MYLGVRSSSCQFLVRNISSNSSGTDAEMASFSDPAWFTRKFVRREQAQKSISKGTVNTVICVTIILGVIFIAFALFVIYWMYMRSIDRRERQEQDKRDRLARLEMMRKAKHSSPGDSYTNERHNSYSDGRNNERTENGSGRLRGKHYFVIGRTPTHRNRVAENPSRYSGPDSRYRSPSVSPNLHSRGTNGTEEEPGLKFQSSDNSRAFKPKGIRRPPFESTHLESITSSAASLSEESIDTRHIPFPPNSYQTPMRDERPGHIGFVPDLSPRRLPPRAGASPDDTAGSTQHP